MNTIKYFSTLVVCVFLFVACGANNEKETKTDEVKNNPETTNKDNNTKQKSSGKDSDCKETNISLIGDDFKLDNFKAEGLQVYNDQMQSEGKKYPAIILTMTNYPKEGDYASDPTKENEVKLTISLNGKSGSAITAQAYDISGDGFGKSDNAGANFNTKDRSYLLNLPTGKIEVTYLSAEKICGVIDVQNKSGSIKIKGNFSCKLK